MNEAEVIKKCKNYCKVSQGELYTLYLPYVLTMVRRFGIKNNDEADVIQEIFIEIFVAIETFDRQKGEFKYWLKSIALHKILNIQRKQKRTKQTLLIDSTLLDRIESTNIFQSLIHLDENVLLELVHSLPNGYRTVFNLFVIDGFSHKEISEKLGIDVVTSRSQLSRAKSLLQKKILTLQNRNRYGLI